MAVRTSINEKQICELCNSQAIRLLYQFDSKRIIDSKDNRIMRCQNCGLVFIYPVPPEKDIEKIYSTPKYHNLPYFDNCKAGYKDKGQILLYKKVLDEIESRIEKTKILDIGCGTGAFLDIAKKRGWESFGVDISKRACDYAKEDFNINVFNGELYEANFPDKYFNVITLWDALEHIPHTSRFLKEVHRILKDDGLLFLETINVDTLINRIGDIIYKASFRKIEYPIRMLYGPHHIYYFTPFTLKRFLEKFKFNILEMHQDEYKINKIGVSWPIQMALSIIYLFQKIVKKQTVILVLAEKNLSENIKNSPNLIKYFLHGEHLPSTFLDI